MKKLFKTFTLSLFTLMALYAVSGILQDRKYNNSAFMELDKIDNSGFELVNKRIVAASIENSPSESFVKWLVPVKVINSRVNSRKLSGTWKVMGITLNNGEYEDRKGREDSVTLEFIEDGVVELKYAGEARGHKVFFAKDLTEGNTLDLMDTYKNFHDDKVLKNLFLKGIEENLVEILHLEKSGNPSNREIPRNLAINKKELDKIDYDSVPSSGFAQLKDGIYELKSMSVANIDETEKYDVSGSFELNAGAIQDFSLRANNLIKNEIVEQLRINSDVRIPNGGMFQVQHEDFEDTNIVAVKLGDDIHIKYPNIEGAGYIELVFTPSNKEEINSEYESYTHKDEEINDDDEDENHKIETKKKKNVEIVESDQEDSEEDEVVQQLSDEQQDELMNSRDVASFDFTKP
ncbi:MAG: hypothetical protein H6622_03615 [Halobacteriovoraceae bacterium]|nr:hypothetical protein [Halobacteriovoraceae bacterium]